MRNEAASATQRKNEQHDKDRADHSADVFPAFASLLAHNLHASNA
ncbi:MAG TPA: hypothetical protein VE077_17715 [Candidatus Methylomirabilis sp.]|nr:hypothetical protein [Candidatus Methylomirabilis sp.]